MARKERSDDTLRAASVHLKYEIDMMLVAEAGLRSCIVAQSPMEDALVESYASHLRNVLEFLWPVKPKNDAVLAEDFLDAGWAPSPMPTELQAARLRATKELAHLSYDRLRVNQERKGWPTAKLSKLVVRTLNQFLEHVPPERLDESWRRT